MLLRRGAEAEIHLIDWFGKQAIAKRRVPKSYRLPAIDNELRVYRTRREARLMTDARKIGISVPIIYDIDVMECEIVMEYIDSPRVKDIFNSMGSETRKSLCYQIGRNIGIMHSHNIIHGDLTTSNMLLSHEKLYFIDFSLGEKTSSIEAKGVDLHVLMEAFESTHSEIRDAFQLVFDAYQEEFGKADEVERKIQYIIKRGRYA